MPIIDKQWAREERYVNYVSGAELVNQALTRLEQPCEADLAKNILEKVKYILFEELPEEDRELIDDSLRDGIGNPPVNPLTKAVLSAPLPFVEVFLEYYGGQISEPEDVQEALDNTTVDKVKKHELLKKPLDAAFNRTIDDEHDEVRHADY